MRVARNCGSVPVLLTRECAIGKTNLLCHDTLIKHCVNALLFFIGGKACTIGADKLRKLVRPRFTKRVLTGTRLTI